MASKAVAAKASPATAGKKLKAPQPQAKVRINFKEPLKTGFLSKAGGAHKAFKNRFFVLYKNFLVYYDDETKWRRDVTVERLEVRRRAWLASMQLGEVLTSLACTLLVCLLLPNIVTS